jgi:hypothetical protein
MVAVVASLLHFTVPVAQLVVKVTLSVPHTVPEPVTTGACGLVIFTMFITCDDSLCPQALVHFAVYAPVFDTCIVAVVSPVLHNNVEFTQATSALSVAT